MTDLAEKAPDVMQPPVRSVRTWRRRAAAFRDRYRSRTARLRALLMRWQFDGMGKGCSIGRRVQVYGQGARTLGERVALRNDVILAGNGVLVIGDRTAVNSNCILTSMQSVKIGCDCMLAPFVYVLDVDHEFRDRAIPICRQGYQTSPVEIEDDVWIGTFSVILRGVRIGRGAIVAANSVVRSDVPEYAIVGGSPARVIGHRGTGTAADHSTNNS